LQINQIRCFAAVARCGSITKAAQQMYITQSAMSQTISALERELGVKLFYPSGRGVVLSQIGRRILLNAQMIIDECNLIKHECDLQQSEHSTVIFNSPVLSTQVQQLTRTFYEKYQSISIIRSPPFADGTEIHIDQTLYGTFSEKRVLLFTEEIGIVVPPNHKFYGLGGIDLKELSNQPIISLHKSKGIQKIENYYCSLAGFAPTREREIFTLEELLDLAYDGVGVMFFPFKIWGIEVIDPKRILRTLNPRCYRHIYVEQHLQPTSNEHAVQTFFNHIIQYFQNY
jgi:DNA-binding transcriptional LysR family regulator